MFSPASAVLILMGQWEWGKPKRTSAELHTSPIIDSSRTGKRWAPLIRGNAGFGTVFRFHSTTTARLQCGGEAGDSHEAGGEAVPDSNSTDAACLSLDTTIPQSLEMKQHASKCRPSSSLRSKTAATLARGDATLAPPLSPSGSEDRSPTQWANSSPLLVRLSLSFPNPVPIACLEDTHTAHPTNTLFTPVDRMRVAAHHPFHGSSTRFPSHSPPPLTAALRCRGAWAWAWDV
ncbi:uncharacterized protein BDZ83DRAFT_443178 [Colletotrichum acutatum]|uniref:Uncharacterized protein n=1 Tax=Glomerella acutata TaxID=27357 RepID=A0AAD8UHS4_GLOAC|nr:uncharacterized protein BDZ83DRAFT_443178 [Colletotrichum acutatum]KAK1720454.1 hypothetical protein BDZ83DRAFT_443178 [Colletotrichum acutatum]